MYFPPGTKIKWTYFMGGITLINVVLATIIYIKGDIELSRIFIGLALVSLIAQAIYYIQGKHKEN